jgi:hypothetical protein
LCIGLSCHGWPPPPIITPIAREDSLGRLGNAAQSRAAVSNAVWGDLMNGLQVSPNLIGLSGAVAAMLRGDSDGD